MKNGRIAPPGYVLPNRPSWQGGWSCPIPRNWGLQLPFSLAASAATEWLAIQLNNPVARWAIPSCGYAGTAIFQPFAALVLWKQLRRQSPYQFWSSQGPLDCIRRQPTS